jgi:hypothetical protein
MAGAEEPERNMYIVAKGGPYFPTATNAFTAFSQSFQWPTTSYTIEGGFGAYWGLFGLQLSAGYITTGTANTTTGPTSVHAVPILLLARIRLPLGFIAPYAEGGAGIAIATSSVQNFFSSSNTQVGFEAVGGAGCDLYFGPLIVGAELRFMWLNPTFNFSGVTLFDFTHSLNLSGITVEAYIGYRF